MIRWRILDLYADGTNKVRFIENKYHNFLLFYKVYRRPITIQNLPTAPFYCGHPGPLLVALWFEVE